MTVCFPRAAMRSPTAATMRPPAAARANNSGSANTARCRNSDRQRHTPWRNRFPAPPMSKVRLPGAASCASNDVEVVAAKLSELMSAGPAEIGQRHRHDATGHSAGHHERQYDRIRAGDHLGASDRVARARQELSRGCTTASMLTGGREGSKVSAMRGMPYSSAAATCDDHANRPASHTCFSVTRHLSIGTAHIFFVEVTAQGVHRVALAVFRRRASTFRPGSNTSPTA